MIKVWIKNPGENWESKEIENDLKVMQDIIGGYIEAVYIDCNTVILCDEDGLSKKLPINTTILNQVFVGPIIMAGYKDGEITDFEVPQKLLQRIFN